MAKVSTRKLTLLITVALLWSSLANGQSLLEGRIVDAESGKPVPFASVGIVGTAKGTSSNLDGAFTLSLAQATSVKITCVGYESVEVPVGVDFLDIRLKPIATQLKEVVVFDKAVNPRKIVRKAFGAVADNFDPEPFFQQFFYRHYCKDDSVYGRLIEASVDVWKHQGYRPWREAAGHHEEIKVTQLRRSLDRTVMAQGHVPIAIHSILQADLAAYQEREQQPHLSLHREVSNLREDLDRYDFAFEGITTHDGQEVYEITYRLRPDSLLTTAGYRPAAGAKGSLFITTAGYAFVKAEEFRFHGRDTVRTLAYYHQSNGRYYPYHLVREAQNYASDGSVHWVHIELVSVEIRQGEQYRFEGTEPTRETLSAIPYDSSFWDNNTALKTTPLEEEIILHLGRGQSLSQQFQLYRQYEFNLSDGGNRGEEKFAWLRSQSRGKQMIFAGFWSSNCESYLGELERFKRLRQLYRNNIVFVLLSLEDDDQRWKQVVSKYNLAADGIVHYRIGSRSRLLGEFGEQSVPGFVLLERNGAPVKDKALHPSDPRLEEELKLMVAGRE
jgi:hypothetical protein